MRGQVVILAAGRGSRMCSTLPKALHEVACRPLIGHVALAANLAGAERQVLVVSEKGGAVSDYLVSSRFAHDLSIVVQESPGGTGQAAQVALPECGQRSSVVFTCADIPCVTPDTFSRVFDSLATNVDVAVVTFRASSPSGYGRIVTDGSGSVTKICEAREADAATLKINLCNSGIIGFAPGVAGQLFPEISGSPVTGEYYLTDAVAVAAGAGLTVASIEVDEAEVSGVNSRVELAQAEMVMQERLRKEAMLAGVTMRMPETVSVSADAVFGTDIIIEPFVTIGRQVRIGENTHILGFSHLEGVDIGAGCSIGPFARIRPGTGIGDACRVGNFCEIKNSAIGSGSKVGHLAYVGDADLEAGVNVGAGAVTCNYDGVAKHRSTVGAGSFIGSNTAIVSPVRIGSGSYIATGTVVTRDIPEGAAVIGRTRESFIRGGTRRIMDLLRARKK